MFQFKMILEADRGRMVVESEAALSANFRVMLLLNRQTA
jgi:hypothetical protein